MTSSTDEPSGSRASTRHLLEPPIDCRFGTTSAMLTDLSVSGARLCHWKEVEGGVKSNLEFELGSGRSITFESLVVWSHPVTKQRCGDHSTGLKLIADPNAVGEVIETLVRLGLTKKIAENRRSNRFFVQTSIDGRVGEREARICDLSSSGARVESSEKLQAGERYELSFELPRTDFLVSVTVEVIWSYLTAIWSETENRYSSGLRAVEQPGMMRAAIGHLSDLRYAEKDVRSLALKSRLENYSIGHAASNERVDLESGGRISLVRRVRNVLETNDVDSARWRKRAEEVSQQPDIRGLAGPIAQDVEALAVWEFLDRSIDPSLVVLGFQ